MKVCGNLNRHYISDLTITSGADVFVEYISGDKSYDCLKDFLFIGAHYMPLFLRFKFKSKPDKIHIDFIEYTFSETYRRLLSTSLVLTDTIMYQSGMTRPMCRNDFHPSLRIKT